jgi:hypothetical protein
MLPVKTLEMKPLGFFRCALSAGFSLYCMGICIAAPIEPDQILPVSALLCKDMIAHRVLKADAPVGCERLRLIKFAYIGFDGNLHEDGEMVVMDAVAEHVLQAFIELRKKRFPLAKARLMNAYEGDDDASMADNNSSAFNQRRIAGSSTISLHAYGLAIDLNPVQNPYLKRVRATLTVQPEAGAENINRLNDRPGKIPRAGLAEAAIDAFADNGFLVWGGYWDNPIDYQHFEVGRALADRLVHSTPELAHELFEDYVRRYLTCRQTRQDERGRSACIAAQNGDMPVD